MDYEIPLKDQNKFFDTKLLIDLNIALCLPKEDEILIKPHSS